MPRPKNADAAQTKLRIVRAATTLLADRGRDGASMRDIAAAAGVSAATVHHYFGTKDNLIALASEGLWSGMRSVEAALEHAIHADDDLATLVTKCVRVASAYARENTESVRLVMRGVVEAGALGGAGGSDLLTPFVQHTATLLAAAADRPIARVRLEVASVVALIVRYALADLDQLRSLLALTVEQCDDERLLAAVDNHLVDLALRVLRIDPD